MIEATPLRSLIITLLLLAVGGCAHVSRLVLPEFEGAYEGVGDGGESLRLEVQQLEPFTFGHGCTGGDEFGFAVLGPWSGPAVFGFRGSAAAGGDFRRSPLGIDIELPLATTVTLRRAGDLEGASAGAWAGRYSARGEIEVELRLWQWDDLLAGHGVLHGEPVAVAGHVAADEARLGLLLSDSSLVELRLRLDAEGRRLVALGLGSELTLVRRSRRPS